MSKEGKGALLHRLFDMVSCEYLSELKEPSLKPYVLRAMSQLDPRAFSMEQWSYALSYITGEDVEVRTFEELNAYLRLSGKTT